MRIHITYGPQKKKPKAGDLRYTKKHGLQVRVQCMATNMRGDPIGRMINNGRPMFEWVSPNHLKKWDMHLTPKPEVSNHG